MPFVPQRHLFSLQLSKLVCRFYFDGYIFKINYYAVSLGILTKSTSHAKHHKLCPLPVVSFIGRQEVLDKMEQYFDLSTQFQHVFVLHGLGGSGKSQIAFQFIQKYKTTWYSAFNKVL